MPDDPKPAVPPSSQPASNAPRPPQPAPDAGHIPMSEEMDSAKWTLPPIVPVLIALVAIGIIVAVISYVNRPTPSASGAITRVIPVDQQGNVLVAVHLKFDNVTEKSLWIKNITSELQTADGKKYTDGAAPGSDINRYLQGFPELAEGRIDPLKEEQKIAPKATHTGMAIFSYPVDKAAFDAHKSFSVRVDFYDRPSMILKQ